MSVGSAYKTVFHGVIATLKPKEGVKVGEIEIENLLKATLRSISENMKAMIETYGLQEYMARAEPVLGMNGEVFKQLVLLIGVMDIYNKNIILMDKDKNLTFVHHMPMFKIGRPTMVFEVNSDGSSVKLVDVVESVAIPV